MLDHQQTMMPRQKVSSDSRSMEEMMAESLDLGDDQSPFEYPGKNMR